MNMTVICNIIHWIYVQLCKAGFIPNSKFCLLGKMFGLVKPALTTELYDMQRVQVRSRPEFGRMLRSIRNGEKTCTKQDKLQLCLR
jgi:hypothetical protein